MLRAGEIQLRGQAAGFEIRKKGSIDLVTEIDLECERMCRAVIAERFPGHDILAEELGASHGASGVCRADAPCADAGQVHGAESTFYNRVAR